MTQCCCSGDDEDACSQHVATALGGSKEKSKGQDDYSWTCDLQKNAQLESGVNASLVVLHLRYI